MRWFLHGRRWCAGEASGLSSCFCCQKQCGTVIGPCCQQSHTVFLYMHISHISSCLLDMVVLSLMVKSAWRHHYLANPTWKDSILFLNVPCTGWALAIWVVPWQFSRLPSQTHGLDWRKNAGSYSLTNLRGAFDTRPSHTSCVANRNR